MGESLADRFAVEDLARDYAAAVDQRRGAALADLFLPDGTFVVARDGSAGDSYRGRGEIPRLLTLLADFELTLHEVVSHRLELAGDAGRGEVTGIAHHVRRLSGRRGGGRVDGQRQERGSGRAARDFVMYLRYFDEYRRGVGRWRFASRRLTVLWTESRRVRLP